MYADYAAHDEVIKEFVEKIRDSLQLGGFPLHYFQINDHDNYCVVFFDSQEQGKSFEILVKDLETGKVLPTLLTNCLDEVAFDKGDASFYYTITGPEGYGKKVMKHRLGALTGQDGVVYEEESQDFHVLASNTLSGDFVLINIDSTFKPKSNEVWVRPCQSWAGEGGKYKF